SMGWNACLSLRKAVADAMRVVAIELVCAAEAVDLRGLQPGPATAAVMARLRERVPRMDVDRFLSPDLAHAEDLVRSGAVLAAVPGSLR
ncbi:MAG TPA: aromatic amino acid lyase, partial [Acidimicrobiales bacterium]|nr:aromatic amino acid lyase [Acidimicrobiales bacterium]